MAPSSSQPSRRRAPRRWRRLEALLAAAASPFVVLGGSGWDAAARAAVTRFAERFELPVATGFRRLPLFDPLHPNYAGDLGLGPNPTLLARVKAADLVLAIGEPLGDVTSQGYTLFDIPEPQRQAGPCAAGTVRARPCLAPAPRHKRHADALRRLAGGADAARQPALAWRGARGARRVSRLVGQADAAAGRGQPRRDHDLAARAPAGRRHPHQRRRQLRRLGEPLLSRAPLRRTPGAQLRLDGLWRAGCGRHAAAGTRAGAWWRSAATATS